MQTFKQPLSFEEESYYLSRFHAGDAEARNLLVEYNLRLVAHIVKKYQTSSRCTEDLLSIGTIGLIKAINTYDEKKGSRLVTYASRCIENELLMRLRRERKEAREVSLYEPIGIDKEGNEISLIDIISIEDESVLHDVIISDHIQSIRNIYFKVLTKREQTVLAMRYGLYDYQEQTQQAIATKLNISRSYVSRIEKKALHKLRNALSD